MERRRGGWMHYEERNKENVRKEREERNGKKGRVMNALTRKKWMLEKKRGR